MRETFNPIAPDKVQLVLGVFEQRYSLTLSYLESLKYENILQNYYCEAGIVTPQYVILRYGHVLGKDSPHWGGSPQRLSLGEVFLATGFQQSPISILGMVIAI